MQYARLIKTADSVSFEKQIDETLTEFNKRGLLCEIQYQPVIVTDENEYIVFTALITGFSLDDAKEASENGTADRRDD